MALFVGYICNNTENMPTNVSDVTHVRVRIPQFHGDINNTNGDIYFADNQLPWARMRAPQDTQNFCATGYYEDGTVVLVDILNNDLNNLMISGTIGNYAYTTDPTELAARAAAMASGSTNVTSPVDYTTETSESVAKSIVAKALEEANTTPIIHDQSCNKVKYNNWFYGKEVSGESYPWCCAFVCWVFYQCNLAQYFNGGVKTASCRTLYNYHKDKGELVSGSYKAGDLIFMNLDGGTSITHVEIAVSDYNESIQTIDCVGGNIYHKLENGVITSKVGRETRKKSQIIAAVRPGTAIYSNRNDPNWKQFDPKWKDNLMGSKTIGQVGCAMTSVSILLRMTGLTQSHFSPAVLNTYLRTHNGYTGNSIYWSAMNNYVDSWKYVDGGTLTGSDNNKIKTIKKLLDEGYYLVISVKNNGHWVAATGYSGKEILMSDPGKSTATKLFATYGGKTITRYIRYSCKNKFKMT